MVIRQLTDDEKERLLSQEEVNNLDEGTEVMVKWSGGNGPHKYELEFHYDTPGIGSSPLNRVSNDPESGLTKVFLPQ